MDGRREVSVMRMGRRFLIATWVGVIVLGEAVAGEPGKEPGPIPEPTKLEPICPSRDLCTTEAAATVRVPHQVPTIQKAIEQIAAKGTVLVASGAYRENLRIPEGKQIVLKGAGGSRETRLRPRQAGRPTITVEPGAKACISGLEIQGGRVGILAGEFLEPASAVPVPDQSRKSGQTAGVHGTGRIVGPIEPVKPLRRLGRPAGALAVRDVKVAAGERGILAFADRIEICGGEVEGCGWGAALIGREVIVRVLELFGNEGGLGVLDGGLCSSSAAGEIVTESVTIDGLYADFNDGPGLVICGANNVTVRDSSFAFNGIGNVVVFDSSGVELDNLGVDFASAVDGQWGDGVIAIDSTGVEVKNSSITFSDRAGIYYNNSGGEIRNNFIANNVFAVALEGGADPLITDDNVFTGNERNEVVVGEGLEPPPPVEPAQD